MTAVEQEKAVAPEDRSVEELAEAIDTAMGKLTEVDKYGKLVAEDIKTAFDDTHRAAIVRMVRALKADERGKELLFELVDDPVVRMVLRMHEIIRPDPMTQAQAALDAVRPGMQSHGGDVELVNIEDGVAYVRLQGACNGCSMSAVTMRNGVEDALKEAVPGVVAVEVLPNEPGPALIQLSEMGLKGSDGLDPAKGWVKTLPIGDFELDALTVVEEANAVVVNLGGQLSAYVNLCAHMGMPLDDAEVDPATGTLTCNWHGYCYDALSGECTSFPGAQLDQMPLRVDDGVVWIRKSA